MLDPTVLAPNKTSPQDITPMLLMKLCKDEMSAVICHLANISFTSGQFPTSMRTWLVTPLLKKPGLDVDLSLICLHSLKILERLALARLKPHITSSRNYCPLQSAYRQLHSTETAIMKIVDDMLTAMDRGHAVTVVGFQMSSAFDAICHHTLIDRLQSDFGVTGTCLQWITSYISDRLPSVHVNSTASESVSAHFGVPQGSVLGPVLLTVYVAPVGRLISHTGIDFHQYADDINIYTSLSPSSADLTQLTLCTNSLQHWLWHNGLLLNPDKYVAALFGTWQHLARPGWPTNVAVAGSDIKMSDHLKVLGVTLDLSMTLDTQVTATVRTCNFHLQSLRQLQSYLPLDVAQSIAFAIIGSWLDYCNYLYYGMSNNNFQRLQRVQNAAARIVCQAPRRQHHSDDLLKDLHWLPMRGRVYYKIAVLCYKAAKLQQPSYLTGLLSSYTQSCVF